MSTRAEREAIAWEVRLRAGDADDGALRELGAWLAADPGHAAAWASLQQRLRRMGACATASTSASTSASAVAHALRTPDRERRAALRAGFGMALLALGAWPCAHELGLDADWRTGVGARRSVRLADGASLHLDAGSQVDRAAGGGAAHLVLRRGQVAIASPGAIGVTAAGALVECTGAELAVGRLGVRTLVAVRGGGARIVRAGRAPLALPAGRSVVLTPGAATPSTLSFGAATAWTHGVLVADRLPLPDLIDALGRYHHGWLRVTGDAAARRVSGVFPLERLDAALAQLAAALPVRVRRHGEWLTEIGALDG